MACLLDWCWCVGVLVHKQWPPFQEHDSVPQNLKCPRWRRGFQSPKSDHLRIQNLKISESKIWSLGDPESQEFRIQNLMSWGSRILRSQNPKSYHLRIQNLKISESKIWSFKDPESQDFRIQNLISWGSRILRSQNPKSDHLRLQNLLRIESIKISESKVWSFEDPESEDFRISFKDPGTQIS